MTPAPALTAVLDELDELRAKATPGQWHVAKSGAIDAGEYDTVIDGGPVDCMAHCYGGMSTLDGDNLPADAALIVAAVNRLSQLTAALRAVERRIQDWDVMARELHHVPVAEAYADVVIGLRAAITTALEES